MKILFIGGTGFLGPHAVNRHWIESTPSHYSIAARPIPGCFPMSKNSTAIVVRTWGY